MKTFLKIIFILLFFSGQVLAKDKNLLQQLNILVENPGNLNASFYLPTDLPKEAPLIVILHGCSQDSETYLINSGWKEYADQLKFVLLFPEQKSSNNPMTCFNWFQKEDQIKGKGEPQSIMNFISQLKHQLQLEPNQIFVTGFSAGAGMSANLLSLYPSDFSSGALISGIPFGCAEGSSQGFLCMYGMVNNSPEVWANKVKVNNRNYRGPYPSMMIWQGESDYTVKPAVADELSKQWTAVHNIKLDDVSIVEGKTFRKSIWNNGSKTLVEMIIVKGLGHAIPLETNNDQFNCGNAGQWEKPAGICSTREILRFWDILP